MTCLSHIRYRIFSRKLHDKAATSCLPIGGTLEPTFRCNLRCTYCFTNCNLRPKEEMTTREIFRIIDTIVDHGCLWLLITGGDPLVRTDFRKIYTHAKKRGMIVTLFTNGTLVTPAIADFLGDMRPFNLEITILGATAPTYEALSGVKGSFSSCLNGIRLLLERNIKVFLKTVITKMNVHELSAMKKLARSLGVSFRFDPTVIPRLDGSREPMKLGLKPKEIVALEKDDRIYRQEFSTLFKKFGEMSQDRRIFSCGGGVASFVVNPYGRLQFCDLVEEPNYDLKNGDFDVGWYKLIPALKRKKTKSNFPCNNCNIQVMCEQCPGWARLYHGKLEKRVDFLCEVAHLRRGAFAKGVDK